MLITVFIRLPNLRDMILVHTRPSLKYILILSFHTCLGLSSALLPSGFPTKLLRTFRPSPKRGKCQYYRSSSSSKVCPLYNGFPSPVSVSSILFLQSMVCHAPSYSIYPSLFRSSPSSRSLWFPF
jgi:hypothetical protein